MTEESAVFQYVPLIKSLKCWLGNQEVLDEVNMSFFATPS